MTGFSVVLNGRVLPDHRAVIRRALKQASEVVLSTWSDPEYDDVCEYARELGCKVVRSPDPGSVHAYTQQGIAKTLNVQRFFCSFSAGLDLCTHSSVIRSRPDVEIDYALLHRIFFNAGNEQHKIGVLQTNTVVPERLLAPRHYLSVCDWLHVGSRDLLSRRVDEAILNEADYRLETPKRSLGKIWEVRLSAEQIIAAKMMGLDDSLYSNFDGGPCVMAEHKVFLGDKFNLLSQEQVPHRLLSTKNIAARWYSQTQNDFSDDMLLTSKPLAFSRYLAVLLKSHFSSVLGKKKWLNR